ERVAMSAFGSSSRVLQEDRMSKLVLAMLIMATAIGTLLLLPDQASARSRGATGGKTSHAGYLVGHRPMFLGGGAAHGWRGEPVPIGAAIGRQQSRVGSSTIGGDGDPAA